MAGCVRMLRAEASRSKRVSISELAWSVRRTFSATDEPLCVSVAWYDDTHPSASGLALDAEPPDELLPHSAILPEVTGQVRREIGYTRSVGQAFRVYDLRRLGGSVVRSDLSRYLSELHDRLRNAIHAETRAYTCHAWQTTGGVVPPHDLHWNDEGVAGETELGRFGWSVGSDLVLRIASELDRGIAVRVFTFDSDADLRFEEILVPGDDPPSR